jgi:hypothetical protein
VVCLRGLLVGVEPRHVRILLVPLLRTMASASAPAASVHLASPPRRTSGL